MYAMDSEPLDRLVMRDASGQEWMISVGEDGALKSEPILGYCVCPAKDGRDYVRVFRKRDDAIVMEHGIRKSP